MLKQQQSRSLVGHYIAHNAFTTQNAYFSEFSENEQDSEVSCTTLWEPPYNFSLTPPPH